MLKRAGRIGKNKDFDRAFKFGQSFYGKFLGVRVIDNGLDGVRLGVLVSTKISKKAPIRNLIKRRIRSAFRQVLPELKGGKDIIFVALPPILDKKFEEIKDFVKSTLVKAGLPIKKDVV